jgi:undecaprenyl-diphosphatase
MNPERIMVIIQAIILGIIQGLTEFIPISSSAHLIIVPWLFKWTDPALTSLSFDVALHLGTLAAILVFFWRDWVRLIGAWFLSIKERKVGADPDRRMSWFIVLGCIPGAIAGVLFESKIDTWFHTPGQPISQGAMLLMAAIIALMACLLLAADKTASHLREMKDMKFKDALLIGLAQAAAIFPGVSRAGSTITAGLALGLKRDTAARFSFLLGAPIIAGAGLKSLWDLVQAGQAGTGFGGSELMLFPIGIVVAAISGFFCIKYLLKFLQTYSTTVFVFYRWGLAILIAVIALIRG